MDMLRYSNCVPRTEDDVNSTRAAMVNWSGVREIELVRTASSAFAVKFLAEKRWESFGWKVVGVGKHFKVKG